MVKNKGLLTIMVYSIVLSILGLPNANGQSAGKARMQWWNDQKFGMFVHYGPWYHNNDRDYTNGVETSTRRTREEAIKTFDPQKGIINQWVDLAKEAGMHYIVFTAKHTQSFTFPMWKTKTTDYGITFPPCPYSNSENPDFVAEYVKTVRNAGLGVGFYYPWDDKEHPDGQWFEGHRQGYIPDFVTKYPDRWKNFIEFEKSQIKELLTQYGPVDYFWFDGGYINRSEDALPLLKMMKELQTDIILNNRGTLSMADVLETPESCIPRKASPGYWETCMGVAGKGGWIPIKNGGVKEYMTIGQGWYDYQGPNMEYKDVRELIQALCTVASKGGNFLLGVGPRPDGTIPEAEVALLKQMGKWLHVNGESIFGTIRSPFKNSPEWGVITRKGQKIYLHVFDWPERTGILPFNIPNNIKSVKLLASGRDVTWERVSNSRVELRLPEVPGAWEPNIHAVMKAPDQYVSVLVMEVEGEVESSY